MNGSLFYRFFVLISVGRQDYLPILKYVPSWFPKASFKVKAEGWRRGADKMLNEPFDIAKKQIVCISKFFLSWELRSTESDRSLTANRQMEPANHASSLTDSIGKTSKMWMKPLYGKVLVPCISVSRLRSFQYTQSLYSSHFRSWYRYHRLFPSHLHPRDGMPPGSSEVGSGRVGQSC